VSRGVRHNHHFVSSQKLLDAHGCVGGGIVVVQELIPTLPLSWTFSLQAFMQLFQRLPVKLLIYCLCWRNELPLHYPVNIVLTLEQTCCAFFLVWANLVFSTYTDTAWGTFSRFWSVRLVEGWPQRSWSSTDIFPLLK